MDMPLAADKRETIRRVVNLHKRSSVQPNQYHLVDDEDDEDANDFFDFDDDY